MFKKHYTRFLSNLNGQLHFAAHSHHAWPDVTRDAHLQYWDDSARLWDDKWESVFETVLPQAQKHIAEMLNVRDEKQVVFAPNTHELVVRLLSTFEPKKPIRILTTNHEFHSFRRQTQRMEEAGLVETKILDADELSVNRDRFIQKLKQDLMSGSFDLFFMSQVFFDSGLALETSDLESIVSSAPAHTVICVDGYHAFGAIPVDLSELEGRIFYLGGGYKYAQAGEGACFMVVPKGNWKPVNTGWFAEMDTLSGSKGNTVAYPANANAFWGSTFDPSGLYRFNAVWELFRNEDITVEKIHAHVKSLQEIFINAVPGTFLKNHHLINAFDNRGHFITFDMDSPEHCARTHDHLRNNGIWTDFRGQRLRFGFGMYQDLNDVHDLVDRLKRLS